MSESDEGEYGLGSYVSGSFDEMMSNGITEAYKLYGNWLKTVPPDLLKRRNEQADILFRRMGITFAVYGEQSGVERLIPFDPVPRILSNCEWEKLNAGICQRVKALNAFIEDVYTTRDILRTNVIPEEMVLKNSEYIPEVEGFSPPNKVHVHISGIDIVRTSPSDFYVLEDNLRTPSGVSYMMENREVMMRLFPDLFKIYDVLPVNHYPAELRKTLEHAAPQGTEHPKAVLFTPGIYNSAYFEHAFLAYEMGIELVQGQDLFVDDDDCVYMRTIRGPEKVDVIYRRIDDRFLDPETFRKDSLLGCPGLYRAAMKKNVTLVNAIGNGVADDKSVYPYVPDMIEFYLGEKPILSNVPTYTLSKSDDFKYVLEHLNELVVKEKHGSGGYGMLVGPKATKAETEEFKERIKQNPDNYIAQPTLALSTCPTVQEEGLSPRHVDLRPYALMQSPDKVVVVPGALTRVALKKGSLVVNSSQGGGTKDTWVLGKTEGDGQC